MYFYLNLQMLSNESLSAQLKRQILPSENSTISHNEEKELRNSSNIMTSNNNDNERSNSQVNYKFLSKKMDLKLNPHTNSFSPKHNPKGKIILN